jgi:hypothetical protein
VPPGRAVQNARTPSGSLTSCMSKAASLGVTCSRGPNVEPFGAAAYPIPPPSPEGFGMTQPTTSGMLDTETLRTPPCGGAASSGAPKRPVPIVSRTRGTAWEFGPNA